MFKTKKSQFILGFLAISMVFTSIGFAVGYYKYSFQSMQQKLAREKQEELLDSLIKSQEENIFRKDNENEKQVTSFDNIINKDTILIHETFYTKCEDTIEIEKEKDVNLIGLNEEGLKNYIKENMVGWELKTFSKDQVILSKRENKACPNHYLVSVKEGYITIYKYDEESIKVLIKQTEIPISILPIVDQERLQRGILVNTMDEVHQLLEDYSG